MLVFREEKSPEDETKAWQFWHSRQHSVKQRILDAGESKDSFYLYYFPSVKEINSCKFLRKKYGTWHMPSSEHAYLATVVSGDDFSWVFSVPPSFPLILPTNQSALHISYFPRFHWKKILYHSTWYDYYDDDARNTLLSQIPFFTQNIPKNPYEITTIIIIRLSRSSHHH